MKKMTEFYVNIQTWIIHNLNIYMNFLNYYLVEIYLIQFISLLFIISLFYPLISTFGWIECWCSQQRPDIYEDQRPFSEWELLYNFIYKDNNVEDLKEILGLNICLK